MKLQQNCFIWFKMNYDNIMALYLLLLKKKEKEIRKFKLIYGVDELVLKLFQLLMFSKQI